MEGRFVGIGVPAAFYGGVVEVIRHCPIREQIVEAHALFILVEHSLNAVDTFFRRVNHFAGKIGPKAPGRVIEEEIGGCVVRKRQSRIV